MFSSNKKRKLSTAEMKIIVALCSFILFAVFSLAQSSYVQAKSDIFIASLTDYFKCEAFGHIPGKCNRSNFEQHYNQYLVAISNILLGLIPLSILNFVLKWRSVQKKIIVFFKYIKRSPDSLATSTKSTNISTSDKGHMYKSDYAQTQ